MRAEKLTMMANQIGAFFKAQGEKEAPAAIADHLKKFWEPRMRRQLAEYIAGGGAGLHALVLEAAKT